MPTIYTLTGFNNYIIIDKILYRKPYKTKSKSCQLQYREKREIKRTFKNKIEGYYLERNKETKFYPLKKLRHRLKLVK
jgi:hypothetical protein